MSIDFAGAMSFPQDDEQFSSRLKAYYEARLKSKIQNAPGATPVIHTAKEPLPTTFYLTYEGEVVLEIKHTVEPDKPVTIQMDGVINLAIMRGDLRHVEKNDRQDEEVERSA